MEGVHITYLVMQTSDLYRKALRYNLETKGVTQAAIAAHLGIQPQSVNDFLNGRRNFSQERQAEIARMMGTTYIDMLILGRKLAEQETHPLAPPDNVKPLPHAEIISKFINPETARKINEMLVEIEARDQDTYRKIEGYIEAKYEEIKDKPVKKISGDEES